MSVVLHDRLAPLRAHATPRSRTPTLPPLAWLYFAAVALTAALLTLDGIVDRQAAEGDWLRFALLTGFASVAQLLSVHIGRNRVFHPAMVFVVAAILLLPPELVALMCVAQHGPEWLKERYPWYIQSFNIANYVVAALAAGAAASILGGTDGSELATVLAGLSACIVFIALNRGLLAAMLRLGRSQSLRETGLLAQEDLALEFVLASMGIAVAAFWLANPWLAPISLAPLALIYYAQRSSLRLYRASETIQDQNEALEDANRLLIQRSTAAMESLSAAVDARDAYTAGHSRRVRAISLQIGEELGLGPEELETLASASLFHDIGKIAVPDAVLLKPGRLTDDEWSVMRSHA